MFFFFFNFLLNLKFFQIVLCFVFVACVFLSLRELGENHTRDGVRERWRTLRLSQRTQTRLGGRGARHIPSNRLGRSFSTQKPYRSSRSQTREYTYRQ